MRFFASLLITTALVSQPALAGDEVLYDAPPEWVDQRELDREGERGDSPVLLIDQQARIESGRLWSYIDTAVALDSPQTLTQFGTLSATWLPDKGDLVVHSAQLIRGDEVIDLLDGGAEFEILRREQGLESRLLNGALTATMTVPGARLGDVVRLAYSTSVSDQAMGENVQWQSGLIAEPFPLADGRVSVSWPDSLPVSRVSRGQANIAEPELVDGYRVWSVDLPVAEADPFPEDAPTRFQLGELMQVATYANWQDVSSSMAVHYDPAGTIDAGGDLASQVARIAAEGDNELTRAALALQLVQDDVSYLLNGLDGGNYLPQSPEETWEKRFGDCKAKSMLLLAMLQELGVTSELVLVNTAGGDALPALAPMPGNFNHIVVRAEIDGTTYWLDGTSSGSRLDTIGNVPRFHYGLPLRSEGAELLKLEERALASPDRLVRLNVDQSSGVKLPALFDIEIEFRGALGAQWRTIADQGDEEMRANAVANTVNSVVGFSLLRDETVTYDNERGIILVTARGVVESPWTRDDTEYELVAPSQAAKNLGFEVDRARADWRDIPLRLNGPVYSASEYNLTLPAQGSGEFELDGNPELRQTIGGVEVSSAASLEGNQFVLSQGMRSILEELPASEISTARRALARFDRSLPVIRSSGGVREFWEYFGEDRALLAPIEEFYALLVEEAEPDESAPLVYRAYFREQVFDYEGSLADTDAAIEIEASRYLYSVRAYRRRELGDLEGALSDLQLAEDLQPDGSTYSDQIEILALLGETEEAIFLAEDYASFADNPVAEANLMASALGWAGSVEDGLELLQAQIARRPGDGTLLNGVCWNAAIWNVLNEERMNACVDAVEKSDYSAAALDSRALAHFRMGDLDAARADIDAALLAQPGQTSSRLLRGIIKVEQGEVDAGREEIALALRMRPSIEALYRAWGLEF